jgi:hypothetical protein
MAMAAAVHAHMRAMQLNHKTNGRRARHQDGGAQWPRAALNYNYEYAAAGPTRQQGHRRARGGTKRDTGGTGGHKGNPRVPRDTRGAGGHKGDPRDTSGDQRGNTGGSERAARPEGSAFRKRFIDHAGLVVPTRPFQIHAFDVAAILRCSQLPVHTMAGLGLFDPKKYNRRDHAHRHRLQILY